MFSIVVSVQVGSPRKLSAEDSAFGKNASALAVDGICTETGVGKLIGEPKEVIHSPFDKIAEVTLYAVNTKYKRFWVPATTILS